LGFCRAGSKIEISWFGLHHGEEPPISGASGSGTIFFCRCNLKCVFCQNWQISQKCIGCRKYPPEEVAEIMLGLQKDGAHNINLVTPTIWSYWLKKSIILAKKMGLKIPVLWNSNAYEKVEILKEFAGLVEIYLPDYKYDSGKLAVKYSSAPNYPEIAQKAILEMQRQVGDLMVDKKGITQKGLIVRHLIIPNALENTKNSLKFIRSISENIHLSLMSQYNPLYRACEFGEINRPLNLEEFEAANKLVEGFNFKNGWIQEFGGSVKCLNPDFTQKTPFG
jgi:putative pyruvate formate lyase activating enzyme